MAEESGSETRLHATEKNFPEDLRFQPLSTGLCRGVSPHYQNKMKNICNHSHADLITTIRYFKRKEGGKNCKLENCILPHPFFLSEQPFLPLQKKQPWETIKKILKNMRKKQSRWVNYILSISLNHSNSAKALHRLNQISNRETSSWL